MIKNKSGQKLRVFAFDANTNLPVTGDAANITILVSNDAGGSYGALADVNPTEISNGYYEFDMTQAETFHYEIKTNPVSSTANVLVIGVPGNVLPIPYSEAGYVDGFVYLDASAANTGTDQGNDGTMDKPVSTWAAARTLALLLGKKIFVIGKPAVDPTADFTDFIIKGGVGGHFDGDSVTAPIIANAKFIDVTVSGYLSTAANATYTNCIMEDMDTPTSAILGFQGTCYDCTFPSGSAINYMGELQIINGVGITNGPNIRAYEFGSAHVEVIGFKGRIRILNFDFADAFARIVSDGDVWIDATSSNTDGDLELVGLGNLVDSSTGTFNVNATKWQELPVTTGSSASIYYPGGYVYFDPDAATAGAVLGVNGTLDNPCGVEADALTLANLLGHKIWILSSTGANVFSLNTNANGISFYGSGINNECVVNLGAAATWNQASFHGLIITGETDEAYLGTFYDCNIQLTDAGTGMIGEFTRCMFLVNTILRVGDNLCVLNDCYGVNSNGATIANLQVKMLGSSSSLVLNDYKGSVNIAEMAGLSEPSIVVNSNGATSLILAVAVTTGYVKLYGMGNFNDNSTSLDSVPDVTEWQELPTTSTNPSIVLETTISALTSQVSFTLNTGSTDDNAYNGCLMVIEDATTGTQKAIGVIQDYDGATKVITLLKDPAIFAMSVSDKVAIIAAKELRLQQTLEGTVMGEVNAVPASGTIIEIKNLTNDEADLTVADVLKLRVLTFRTGVLQGNSVAVQAQGAVVAGVVTFLTDEFPNFANVSINDRIELT